MSKPDQNDPQLLTDDAPPPVFKSWRQLYLFVLVMHAIIITLFYWFTKAYS